MSNKTTARDSDLCDLAQKIVESSKRIRVSDDTVYMIRPVPWKDLYFRPYFGRIGCIAVSSSTQEGVPLCVVHSLRRGEREEDMFLHEEKELEGHFRSCLSFILQEEDYVRDCLAKHKCIHLYPAFPVVDW